MLETIKQFLNSAQPFITLLQPFVTLLQPFGIFVGIVGTLFIQWCVAYWERKEKATYLAIQLVQSLQRYMSYCRSVVADHIDIETHGQRGQQIEKIPSFKLLESNDYLKLDTGILAQLLNFDFECGHRQNYISENPSLFPDEQNDLYLKSTCEMGIYADVLAERLRQEYKLPRSQYRVQTRAFLEEEFKKIKTAEWDFFHDKNESL